METTAGAANRHFTEGEAMRKIIRLWLLPILLTGLTNWGGSAMAVGSVPPLGVAGSFAVLGATTVTNTGASVITGDVGNSPGAAITGFPPGSVSGTIHAATATAATAQTDATTAYNALVAQACDFGPLGVTDLAAQTLTPAVYCYSSSLANTGLLTLDAGGNPNAVWVFKIGSTLITGAGASVVLINGAQYSNVFWQVGSSATLGTTTSFAGNILAFTSITLTTGANVSGRVQALNGAVTLDTNAVTLSPILTIAKSVAAFSDPVNATINPKAIPESEMLYTMTATNSGYGVADNNTTVITDQIPANMSLCVSTLCSNPPVTFSCSAIPVCGLTYTYGTAVTYSSTAGGVAPFTYLPIPDVAGYDANVTGVRINPNGVFNGASAGGNPSFSLLLKMKIK